MPTVKLDEEAFDCFLTYINQSLDLDEKFINRTNEKGNYSFFFCLLSLIASCAEGIYASETAVGQNEGSDSSLKVEIEPKIADDGILINHEIVLKSKNGASKGPVEFTTSTRIQEICRSVLEVKTSKIIDVCEEAKYQLFAELVVAMEKNMELRTPVDHAIFGAFATCLLYTSDAADE